MTQFNRIASVVIGEPGTGGLEVRGLRIAFNVQKTDGKTPNKAKISIYNLSEKSRNLIKQTGELVFLNAGYSDGDGEENVFIGDVSSINHKIEPPDVVTIIEASDGAEEIATRKTGISFAPGASGMTVLRKILSVFNIGNDLSNLSISDKKYANGFSYAGSADQALDKVCENLGISWSIQNNEIKLIPADGNDGSQIVSLTPSSGILGAPERLEGRTRKAKGKSKVVKPGWRVRALLQPKLTPGGRVTLTSHEIPENSVFKISVVTHSGDTFGSEWATTIEVRE